MLSPQISHHLSLHFLHVSAQIPSSRRSQTVLNTPSSFSCFTFCYHQTNCIFYVLFVYCLSLLLDKKISSDGVFLSRGGALFAWLFGFPPASLRCNWHTALYTFKVLVWYSVCSKLATSIAIVNTSTLSYNYHFSLWWEHLKSTLFIDLLFLISVVHCCMYPSILVHLWPLREVFTDVLRNE